MKFRRYLIPILALLCGALLAQTLNARFTAHVESQFWDYTFSTIYDSKRDVTCYVLTPLHSQAAAAISCVN